MPFLSLQERETVLRRDREEIISDGWQSGMICTSDGWNRLKSRFMYRGMDTVEAILPASLLQHAADLTGSVLATVPTPAPFPGSILENQPCV